MFCQICGRKNPIESRFCGVCGKSLSQAAQIRANERSLDRDLPKGILFAEIPKPEGEISDSAISINDAETLVEEIRNENSKEHLKLIFEDAEFILDEILIEEKKQQVDPSQPIIKPSKPL